MRGFRRHIAASASITAVFVVCALALAASAVPVNSPPVEASGRSDDISLAASFADLFRALGEGYGKAAVEAPEPPAAVDPEPQPAPATAVALPAPAEPQPAPAPEPSVPQPQEGDPKPAAPPQPPTWNPPTDLTGTFIPEVPPYIALEWNGNNPSKYLDYFLVYREDVDLPGQIKVVQTKKEKYKDYDITPGHAYRYWVTAVAKWGEESGPSNIIEVKTQVMDPPAPPQDVVAAAIDPGVSLDWRPNDESNLAGYNVYYSRNGRWRKLNADLLTDNHYYYGQGSAGQMYAVSAVNIFGIESGYTTVTAQASAPVIYQESDPAVSVVGFWAIERYEGASGGSIIVAQDGGARLHFTFTGRQVKLIAANYWTCGNARIYIDDELMATVSMYSYDPVFMSVELSAPGLKYGQHTLTVEVVGSGNPETEFNFVNVDAFEVW